MPLHQPLTIEGQKWLVDPATCISNIFTFQKREHTGGTAVSKNISSIGEVSLLAYRAIRSR